MHCIHSDIESANDTGRTVIAVRQQLEEAEYNSNITEYCINGLTMQHQHD